MGLDKKTILVIIFGIIFLLIFGYVVITLIRGSTPYYYSFLDRLTETVANWFDTTFKP